MISSLTLDTSDENLGRGRLVGERRSLSVDGSQLDTLDGATLVDGITSDVHDTTESARADGDRDGGTGIEAVLTTDKTLST